MCLPQLHPCLLFESVLSGRVVFLVIIGIVMVTLTTGQTLRGPLGLPVGLILNMLIRVGRPAHCGRHCFQVHTWGKRTSRPHGFDFI